MERFFLIVALLIAAPAYAQVAAGPSSAMTPPPDERAKQWVSLIDDTNYGQAYQQAGASLRNRTSLDKFQTTMSTMREPLGAMASRSIKVVKLTKTLPAMEDGQYATVQFDSSFAHKAAAVETITLTSEKGGWSVIDYHVN